MTESTCIISFIDEGDKLGGHVGSPNLACGEYLVNPHHIACSTFVIKPA